MTNRDTAGKQPSKARKKRRAGQRKAAPETTLAMIDRHFLMKVPMILSGGEEQKITVVEAIVRQLIKKQLAGDIQASRILQKYEELAPARTERPLQVAFVESDYTQTLAAPAPEIDHG